MPPQFTDITLYDKDTGEPFIFTAKEQEFFARQGFTNVPTRSPERRKLVREQRYKGKPVFNVTCLHCGRVGKVMQEPPEPRQIYCQYCFAERWNEYIKTRPALQEQFGPVTIEEPTQAEES
jgi:CxxC-x17-CxxC domain-containing protein